VVRAARCGSAATSAASSKPAATSRCRCRPHREAAGAWLAQNYEHIGERSTVDLNRDYLDAPVFGPDKS
jgi:hypothetical protein